MSATIWILTGPSGAGKTTVAGALCRRYAKAIHIPVDDLRAWVRSGYASPIGNTTSSDVRTQFQLARQAVCSIARDYARAGFTVIVDDVVGGIAREAYDPLVEAGARRVVLMPSLEVARERNRTRTTKSFDTSILDPATRSLHGYMTRENTETSGWTVIDSTALSIEETVDELVKRCGL